MQRLSNALTTRRVSIYSKPRPAVHKHQDRNGQVLHVETKAFPLKDIAVRVTSVIETINNITEKHLLKEERLNIRKLDSIGTLAGGIAHDFNNLLQGVSDTYPWQGYPWTVPSRSRS